MVNVSPIKITQKVLHDIGMHSFYWLKSFKCIPKANKTKSLVSIFLDKNGSKIKFCKNDLVCWVNSPDFENKVIWYWVPDFCSFPFLASGDAIRFSTQVIGITFCHVKLCYIMKALLLKFS